MVRTLAAALAIVLGATAAEAQVAVFSGSVTARLGAASQGDVRGGTITPSVAMAVLDPKGLGVEIDLGHGGDFDNVLFDDSSISTVMLSVLAVYPHPTLRPYVAVGAGLMRVRVSYPAESAEIGQTDTAWNAGGGAQYMLTEGLGLSGEVRYFRQFGRQTSIALGANGVLDFVRSSVGLTFSWPLP